MRAADVEAVAAVGERGDALHQQALGLVVDAVEQDAELVAAEAVGLAAALDHALELAGEADEQRVAGGVAEDVVVVLEAVEVEQRDRALDVGVEAVLEVAHQAAAVAEAGQRVGQRLAGRLGRHPGVVAEGQDHAQDRAEQRGGREHDGEVVEVLDQVAVHEHPQAGERRRGGHDHRAQASGVGHRALARRHPRGPAEQEGRGGPQRVEQRAVDVGAERGLVEEQSVGDRDRDEARADHGPRAAGAPAGEAEHAGHDREQEQVADRVGDVGQQQRAGLRRGADQRLEQEHGGEAGGRERGDDAVEPQPRARAAQAGAHHQHDRQVARGIERQLEPVAQARPGRVGRVGRERPVDLARRPRHQPDAEARPGQPVAAHERGAQKAQHGADHGDAVVDPGAEERVEPVAAEAEALGEQRGERESAGAAQRPHRQRKCCAPAHRRLRTRFSRGGASCGARREPSACRCGSTSWHAWCGGAAP